MRHLLRAIKAQRVEPDVGHLRYLIGVTSHRSRRLRWDPQVPLPLSELIFLNEDDDIRAWLLANQQEDKDPLDLLLLESHQDEGEDPGQTPELVGGTYPFFDQDVWELGGDEDLFPERSGEGEGDGSDDEDAGVDEDENQRVGGGVEEESVEEESVEESGTSPIVVDDEENVSFETQPTCNEQHDKNSQINYTHRLN